ncbi:MAG: alanine dehydrogenase [Alphaproteobacteria bacterium]|nr:alanine dehydrogenase [Alphaproteobacteria bacterium]
MRIGCPKEIKTREYRVGLTPESAAELVRGSHEVILEAGAGLGIGADDAAYRRVGARIVADAATVFAEAEMIVKVKEPQIAECAMLTPSHTLFTYLHLAPDPDQAAALMRSGCTAIAYETVTDADGRLPLLKPMSEVAGRMSIQVGANFLEKTHGGRGVLLGGVPGVKPADVVILGAGVAGYNAAQIAVGMRARVTVFDKNLARLEELDREFNGRLETIYSTRAAVEEAVREADVIIGAVLVPGAAAPKLITRDMLKTMRPGCVLVDISIDQGGCFETSHATTHDDPVFVVDGVIHYCVANMPGAVSRTSAYALNHATLPFAMALANKGARQALIDDPHLAAGLNVHAGAIAHEAVARDLNTPFVRPDWLH